MQEPLSELYKLFQEKQPISLTGIPRHILLWVMSPLIKTVYINPAYDARKRKVAIYCIHGTADKPGAISLVAERLLGQLPDCVSEIRLVGFEDRGKGKNIHYFAKQLKDQIKTNNDEDVVLIGHSRGGIIAAYFTEYLASANRINVLGVNTICSPFAGSDLALPPLTWVSESICEMQPASEFLHELASKMEESLVPYHYFSAQLDWIVSPEKTASIVLERHGHLSILSSRHLVEYLRDFIEQDTKGVSYENTCR